MSNGDSLRGSCSCGRYNYVISIPGDNDARREALVHFGTGDLDRRSHASMLSTWLKVPLSWYRSATVSYFPDERHEHIARTFALPDRPGSQRKFCGFCGTHVSYWTEEPAGEHDYMNITLGTLRRRDLLALEDLDLLPEDVELGELEVHDVRTDQAATDGSTTLGQSIAPSSGEGTTESSKSGISSGLSWFEDMIQGSQLGRHSTKRRDHGVSADGTARVSWEVSEYYESGEEANQQIAGSKRKAKDIESDDTKM